MKEVTIIKCLQAEILKIEVAFRLQHLAEALEVETSEFGIDQFRLNAGPDEIREIARIARRHFCLDRLLRTAGNEGQRLAPQPIKQQAGRNECVIRLLFYERARRHDQG